MSFLTDVQDAYEVRDLVKILLELGNDYKLVKTTKKAINKTSDNSEEPTKLETVVEYTIRKR